MIDYATKRAIRFAITGVAVTGLHVVIAATIIRYIYPAPALANGVAFLAATTLSYITNTIWSFSNTINRTNLFRFILVSFTGLLLAMIVSGTAEHFRLHYMYGIGLVVCTVPPVTFLLHYFWTYRKPLL